MISDPSFAKVKDHNCNLEIYYENDFIKLL